MGIYKSIIGYGLDGLLGALIRILFYYKASGYDYGLLGYLVASAYFFSIFFLLGFDYSIIYVISNDKDARPILSSTLFLPMIGSFLELLTTRNAYASLLAYFSSFSMLGSSILVGKGKYGSIPLLAIIKRGIQAAGMLYLYNLIGITGALLGILGSTLPGSAVFFLELLSRGIYFDLSAIKPLAEMNASIFIIGASLYVDKLTVARVLNLEEFAVYYLAFQAIMLLNSLSDATMRSVVSEISLRGSIDRFSKAFIIAITLLTPLGAFLGEPIIALFFPNAVKALEVASLYLPAAMPLAYSFALLSLRDKRKMLRISILLFILRLLLPTVLAYKGSLYALLGFIAATVIAGIYALVESR